MSEAPAPPSDRPGRKKPPTGRPRGRPPKRDEFLVASEVWRTLLEILDEHVEVRTATGVRKISKFRGVMENLVANAVRGNPTALNHLMRLMVTALEDREKAHPQVWIAEHMRNVSESPDPDRGASYQQVRTQIRYAKNKY